MPSKLKKAIAVVKDQTSISLAMVKTSTSRAHNSSSSLEVAILKATSHDDSPINPHHVGDILRIVSSNRAYASVCARSLGRRVGRTRSWMVALKSLLVVLRLFQANDPHFPKEVLHAMKTGYKILNLHDVSFSGGAASRESAAFVRSFAAYLSTRLLAPAPAQAARETNPDVLLDRVPRLQRLLDKAIAMAPTRRPPSNRLVLAALHAVARESFGLYKDVSDGLALLLDGFFHLQHASCVSALDACVGASRQFERLRDFYDLCVSSGIGTPSEYPDVKDIPDELIETLREFLKDQSSFPAPASGRRLPLSLIGSCSSPKSGDNRYSDPGDEKLSPMGDFTSSVLSDSDFRNYSSLDFLDHEEGAAMLQGTSARKENGGDEESSEQSDDDNHQTASGWELALLETTMQQPSTSNMNSNHGFGVDFMEADATSSLLSHPSSGQYNPFLQDAMHDPSPMGNEGVNVTKSDDDFFKTLAFDNGFVGAAATTTTTSEIQPTLWVDFNDNGKGVSVDMFTNTSNYVRSGATYPFSSFDNANSAPPNAFSDASFHAGSSDMNPIIVPNANVLTGIAPMDELATVNRGCENANVGLASLGSGFGCENVTNPLTAIAPANELLGRNMFSSAPTFKADAPFKVASDHNREQLEEQTWRGDPFGSISCVESGNYQVGRGPAIDQQNVHNQQEMWLQIQNKILAKHLT